MSRLTVFNRWGGANAMFLSLSRAELDLPLPADREELDNALLV